MPTIFLCLHSWGRKKNWSTSHQTFSTQNRKNHHIFSTQSIVSNDWLNFLFRLKWQMWMILTIRFFKITKIQCMYCTLLYCLFFTNIIFNHDLSSSSKVKTCRIRIIIYCKASVFLFTGLCIVFMVALHSTEKRCICLMKWNMPYFSNTKMNALVYVNIDQGIY